MIQKRLSSLENSLSQAEYRRKQNLDEYQTALIEDVAGNVDANGNVLDTSNLGTSVSTGADQIRQLKQEIQTAKAEESRHYYLNYSNRSPVQYSHPNCLR